MGGPDDGKFVNAPRPKVDIFDACVWNDEGAVVRFVDEKGVPANVTNSLGQTAAHVAAAHRCMGILDYLLNKDPSLVFATDKWGQTALHVAMQKGFTDVVEYLVEKRKADIYQPIKGRFNNTAVHLAAEECRMEIMIYYIEQRHADINVRNGLGEPPIFSAASSGHRDMVQYLLGKGANVTMVDKDDNNILFMSAKSGDLTVPKYLLDVKRMPFNMDWRNNFGETVLHIAVKHNQPKILRYFVERKPIDIDIFDNLDRTAVYLATEMSNLELVKYLVEHGADYELNDVEGRTPVEIATNPQVKEYLQSLKPMTRGHEKDVIPVRMTAIPQTIEEYTPSSKEKRRRRNVSPYIVEQAKPSMSETSAKLLSGHQLDLVRPADEQSFHVTDALMLMGVGFRYFLHSKNEGKKYESLAPSAKITRDRIDPIAMNAIDAGNVFHE